mmetsp:Transcript_54078/g.99538  ORF Transcript_54078/g.99538 Transcript_54078/m.99538 type:complete len:607 (+) Transcript_54078:51-1871(+)
MRRRSGGPSTIGAPRSTLGATSGRPAAKTRSSPSTLGTTPRSESDRSTLSFAGKAVASEPSSPSAHARPVSSGQENAKGDSTSPTHAPSDPNQKVSTIISVFRHFDQNGDGTLDLTELERLIWNLNPHFRQKDLRILCKRIDVNMDGIISYEELIKWLYGDSKALSRLGKGKRTPRRRDGSILGTGVIGQLYGPNGAKLSLDLSERDTVQDLCLRACVPLGIPIERLSDVNVRLKTGSANLPGLTPLKDFAHNDLQIVLKNQHHLFSASGNMLLAWEADVLEPTARSQTDREVFFLKYVTESDVICAAMGQTLAAWDSGARQMLWQKSVPPTSALTCSGNAVYIGTEDGSVFAYEAASGREIWNRRMPRDCITTLHVVAAHGLLCAGTDTGQIVAWDLASGNKLWNRLQSERTDGEAQVWLLAGATTSDATHPETLISGAPHSIVAWDARNGKEVWSLRLKTTQRVQCVFYREFYDTVAASIQSVDIEVAPSFMCSLDGRNGEELFRREGVGNICYMQGRRQFLYTATDKKVQAWDTLNDHMFWEVEVFGPREPSDIQAFAFAEDLDAIFLGSAEGLQALDARNGKLRAQKDVRGGVSVLNYTTRM